MEKRVRICYNIYRNIKALSFRKEPALWKKGETQKDVY